MIVLPYLALAAMRIAFSPLKPEYRLRVFFLRFLVAALAVIVSVPIMAIMISFKGNQMFGALVAVLFVVAAGEHLIFMDLERRQMLSSGARQLPLGF